MGKRKESYYRKKYRKKGSKTKSSVLSKNQPNALKTLDPEDSLVTVVKEMSTDVEPFQDIRTGETTEEVVPDPVTVAFEEDIEDARVICTYCNVEIVGNLYTCLQCLRMHLCSSCEAAGFHPEHVMLRVPNPILYETIQGNCLKSIKRALTKALPRGPPIIKQTIISSNTQDRERIELSYDDKAPSRLVTRRRFNSLRQDHLKSSINRKWKEIFKTAKAEKKMACIDKKVEEVAPSDSTEDVNTQLKCLAPEQLHNIEVVFPEDVAAEVRADESGETNYILTHGEDILEIKEEIEEDHEIYMDCGSLY